MGLSQYSTEGIVSVLYHHCTDSGVFQALPHLPFSVNVAGTFKAYNRKLHITIVKLPLERVTVKRSCRPGSSHS